MSEEFPVLDKDFVEWLVREADLDKRAPSVDVAFECFTRLGRRPEELTKALVALQNMPIFANADQDLRAITEGVRQSAAAVELARVEDLGPLAQAVFNYVCDEGGGRASRSCSRAQRLRRTDASLACRLPLKKCRRSPVNFSTRTSSPAMATASTVSAIPF